MRTNNSLADLVVRVFRILDVVLDNKEIQLSVGCSRILERKRREIILVGGFCGLFYGKFTAE